MSFGIALMAAFGCALCNGTAAILQKAGADKQRRAAKLEFKLLIRLTKSWPYLVGISLDLLSGVLILVAVHTLPLFLVQAVIASGIGVTFTIEHFLLHSYPTSKSTFALGMIFVGLITLALVASPGQATNISESTKWYITSAIIPVGLLGMLFSRQDKRVSTIGLAILSGIAFGGTSIAGRAMIIPHPIWHLATGPLFYVFIAYGILGITLFTIGLQRSRVSTFNSIMVAAETVFPTFIGIILLGDTVRHGLWIGVAAGILLAVTGAILISDNTEIKLKV